MKKVLKVALKILRLLAIVTVLTVAFVGIAWYIVTADLREIEKKNKEDPIYQKLMAESKEKEKADAEKQRKLDEIDAKKQKEEQAIADFEKSIKGKYNKEYLLKKISSDKKMANRLFTMGGYDCMNYWYTSHNWEDDLCYDELSYYVFKDEKSAQKAYQSIKEDWIDSETDSGKNYVQGWEKDVLDAQVEIFIYQTDNMIITAELQVVSSWAEPEGGDDDNSAVEFYYRKAFIKDNF